MPDPIEAPILDNPANVRHMAINQHGAIIIEAWRDGVCTSIVLFAPEQAALAKMIEGARELRSR